MQDLYLKVTQISSGKEIWSGEFTTMMETTSDRHTRYRLENFNLNVSEYRHSDMYKAIKIGRIALIQMFSQPTEKKLYVLVYSLPEGPVYFTRIYNKKIHTVFSPDEEQLFIPKYVNGIGYGSSGKQMLIEASDNIYLTSLKRCIDNPDVKCVNRNFELVVW